MAIDVSAYNDSNVFPLNATLLASLDNSSMSVKARDGTFDDEVSTACSQGRAEALPCWTKQRVLKLCTELLQGFYSPAFQQELKKLSAESPNAIQVSGRMELALTVQCDVLNKYGFAATVEGVEDMREAICPFLVDWMVKKIVDDIDRMLGLPKNSTAQAAQGPEHSRAQATQDVVPTSCALEGRSGSEVMPTPLAWPACPKSLTFTKAEILVLLGDLLEAFSAADFQEALQRLTKESVTQREQLVLKVQSKVLPKHGLPGSTFGVMLMLDALAPCMEDFLVLYLVRDMDDKIGQPKGTTVNLCKLRLIEVQPAQLEGPQKACRLTRQQVLSLCGDLLQGFNAPEFQESLRVLLQDSNSHNCVPQRAALALSVQSKVLPKYALPGDMEGVLQMLDEIAPYGDDWMIAKLVNSIDEALGLPAETTLASCRTLF